MKRKVPLAILFVLLLGSLPLSAVKKDTKMILDEIQKLADTVASLNEKVDAMAADLAGLAKKFNISDERIGAMSRNQADMAQNREDLMLNMQFFKEELNDIKNSLSKINDRIMNIPAAAGGGTAGAPDNAAGGTRAAEPAISQDPSSIYYAAYSDYIKENFDLAIEGFRQFIRNFPESGLADNSLYWIGECYFSQGSYKSAVDAFDAMLEKYPRSDKAAAANLKKALAFVQMNQIGQGIEQLRFVTSTYPGTDEARIASDRLSALGKP